jgi:twitching motility two-component system response regulator PilH
MSEKKKILVVDDEPDVVRWLTVMLENNGYDAIAAINGREGFDQASSQKPDLIFLDISMPEESGIKMFRKLQDDPATAEIPVVMLTGVSPEFERFIKSRKQVKPPAAYFEKPVEEKDLIAKIKELIG